MSAVKTTSTDCTHSAYSTWDVHGAKMSAGRTTEAKKVETPVQEVTTRS